MDSDFWIGLAVGLSFGVLVGWVWEDAYCMIKSAIKERRGKMDEPEHKSESGFLGWLRGVTAIGLVLAIIAGTQIFLGVFQVIGYTRMGNFIECQAEYNEQEKDARDPRIRASEKENAALYAWLETLPPLVAEGAESQADTEPDPKVYRKFHKALRLAIETHQNRVRAEQENPFPKSPAKTCGEYS